jgi:hypothetical protein
MGMFKKTFQSLVIASFLVPEFAGAAVTKEDFTVRTTRNLVNLCAVSPDDPRAKEAIQMCHGYILGALDFHMAETAGERGGRMVCLPDKVTRDEAVAAFVQWAKAHPQYMNERPVDTEFRYLSEKWPCRK